MYLKQIFAPLILLGVHIPSALTCSPPPPSATAPPGGNNGTVKYPFTIPGGDEPADWATMGYVLNHFSLNVKNLTASMDFYSQVFGMRLMFNFRASEKSSIVYMAHSHGGKNGTQYQTAAEMNRVKNNLEGMLELLHYADSGVDLSPSSKKSNSFSHLGMVVPDILPAEARFRRLGVKIIKPSGGGLDSVDDEGKEAIAQAYGLGDFFKTNPDEAVALFTLILENVPGSIDMTFVLDPDGNLIEVQPQELGQLPV